MNVRRIGGRRAVGAGGRERRGRGADGAGPFTLLPTAPQFLHLQARRRGDQGGLVFRQRRITYGELAAAVDDLAAWLAARGIGAGQRVGVMAANQPALVAATFALWGLGVYAEDDWKVSRNLKLTLALRVEHSPVFTLVERTRVEPDLGLTFPRPHSFTES